MPNSEYDGNAATAADGVFVVDAASLPDAVSQRLRQAVTQAGGHAAVVAKSGVKRSTLTRFLAGHEIKQRALVALADACRVSVEWLATGRGDMHAAWANTAAWPHPVPGEQPDGSTVAAGPVLPLQAAPPPPASLFSQMDMDRMAAAIDASDALFRRNNAVPDARRRAQLLALLYDATAEAVAAHDAAQAAPGAAPGLADQT